MVRLSLFGLLIQAQVEKGFVHSTAVLWRAVGFRAMLFLTGQWFVLKDFQSGPGHQDLPSRTAAPAKGRAVGRHVRVVGGHLSETVSLSLPSYRLRS